jgi:hypothetical protein
MARVASSAARQVRGEPAMVPHSSLTNGFPAVTAANAQQMRAAEELGA